MIPKEVTKLTDKTNKWLGAVKEYRIYVSTQFSFLPILLCGVVINI